MTTELVELTDLISCWEPLTGRRSVPRSVVLDRLRASGQHRAMRIARRLPARGDVRGDFLDDEAVDALLIRVHCELQRLSEELQQGRRVAERLGGWVAELRAQDPARPVRVVDVGCGLGYVLRWLATAQTLGPGVELVGLDLNGTLVGAARALSEREGLDVEFVQGAAAALRSLVPAPERTVVMSTGLLHHLRGDALPEFFRGQRDLGVHAFCHWDPVPGPWSTMGAWMFHRARMREPVSRHDGVLSVRRAHPASALLEAAGSAAPGYELSCTDTGIWPFTLTERLRPIVGVRR
jgi:SAM-dependent methyltransferase